MADIELIIKIPEDTYNDIIKNGFIYDEDNEVVTHAIKNSIQIPKGHGRLIDADKIEHYMLPSEKQDKKTWFIHSEEYRNAVPHFNHAMRLLRDNAPTIIEADKESEDKECTKKI